MDAKTVVWRSTGQYKARRLKGIWATSPYLHNGSAPTLYHMLHPEQRPARFNVGAREYDPEKIGYRSDLPGWTFDTTLPGARTNSGRKSASVASRGAARLALAGGCVMPTSSNEPVDPLIGRTVNGRFKIVSLVARGGMGKVYEAVHEQTRKHVIGALTAR